MFRQEDELALKLDNSYGHNVRIILMDGDIVEGRMVDWLGEEDFEEGEVPEICIGIGDGIMYRQSEIKDIICLD
ncbi:MAG: hypothetical protein Q4Q17_01165 [Tissierellia bacterium]|nr:hypothetical protein [Tissierellia bacterium]